MDLMRRRRMMLQESEPASHWDYIFTRGANGYYAAIPVSVTAGQVVTIEFAPSTATNGYIYYSQGTMSPSSQKASSAELKAGGTLVKEVLNDGTCYFGTNNKGSTYYNFNGEYIKVRIE